MFDSAAISYSIFSKDSVAMRSSSHMAMLIIIHLSLFCQFNIPAIVFQGILTAAQDEFVKRDSLSFGQNGELFIQTFGETYCFRDIGFGKWFIDQKQNGHLSLYFLLINITFVSSKI